MTTEEPIGRLYRFINACAGQPDSNNVRQVWTAYLGLADTYSPEFWRGVALLVELPGRARATVGRYSGPVDADEVEKEIGRAGVAINAAAAGPDQTIGVMKSRYDRGTIQTLKMASSVIGPSSTEPAIDDSTIADLRAAANDLINTLRRDDSLPLDVKQLLFEHAEAVLHALNLIEVGGARPLIDERDRFIGVLTTAPDVQTKVSNDHPVKEKLRRLVAALMVIGTLGHTLLQLPQDVSNVLELTAKPSETLAPPAPEAGPMKEA